MDDDIESANSIILHLRNDFNVEHYLSAKEALKILKEKGKAYDLLILDYDMVKEQNGIEVLLEIKKNIVYYIPAIMVSAVVYNREQVEEALNAGFDRYVHKYDRNLPTKLKAWILELVAQHDNVVLALEKWVKDKPGRENEVVSEWNGKSYTVRNMLDKLKNNGNTDPDQRMRLVKYVIDFLVSESMKSEA